MQKNSLIDQLKAQGYRITKTRTTLLDIFTEQMHPVSVAELLQKLSERNQVVNKTTVYRELEFLLEQKFVQEVQWQERQKRYELTSLGHHHHLICTQCESISDIPLENELLNIEQNITRKKNFRVTSHALEFFGICASCQNNE